MENTRQLNIITKTMKMEAVIRKIAKKLTGIQNKIEIHGSQDGALC